MKSIQSDLNIYNAFLKNWTDLQNYVEVKTGGKISPLELNKIALALLAESDTTNANLASSKDLTAGSIEANVPQAGKNYMWIIWVIFGAGLLLILLFLLKRKKDHKG